MDESLRDQIYESMDSKDTEELQDLWRENDREAWTDEAFDVVREILLKRTDQLPEQKPAIPKSSEDDEDDEEEVTPLRDPKTKRDIKCPACSGTKLIAKPLGLAGPRVDLPYRITLGGGDDPSEEITALACQDCGTVFLMLTDFL